LRRGGKEVWLISVGERTVYVHTSVGAWNEYAVFAEWEIERLPEEEARELVFDHVKSQLFPGLKPLLSKIFAGVK
jgi:hypothetical protein